MQVIPAVDIKSGKAVRLKQGQADQQTVYDDDPLRAARRWQEQGARRIHVVDLDGAFDGAPGNLEITLAILKGISVEVQVGGGVRSVEIAARLLDAGAARCVIGTQVLEDRAFLEEIARLYPGRISVGLDARDGKLMTKGWVQSTETLATDLVRTLQGLPLGEVIYTDIDRDGMLEGPNLPRLEEMRRASPFALIASGGVTTLDQIRACRELGCIGAIVGKAFYDGRMDLPQAQAAAGEA